MSKRPFRVRFFTFLVVLASILFALFALTGCAAVESITEATKDKTVAMGSDTWGRGGEATVASAEQPVPTFSGWFGRRRVWYVSVKDEATGKYAADIVRASNSSDVKAEAGPGGLKVGTDAGTAK